MILDELAPTRDCEGGYVYLEKVIPKQNLIIVLTGDEGSLSALIRFDSIHAQSIPLARADADENIHAIRVPLSTAVSFIDDLNQREEAAFPYLKPSSIDRSLCPAECVSSPSAPNADEWADGALQAADENGIDNVFPMWKSIRRIKAAERGEIYHPLEPETFTPAWR